MALVLILVAGILVAALLGFVVHGRKTVPGMYLHVCVPNAAVVDLCTHTLILVQVPRLQDPRHSKHPMQSKRSYINCSAILFISGNFIHVLCMINIVYVCVHSLCSQEQPTQGREDTKQVWTCLGVILQS